MTHEHLLQRVWSRKKPDGVRTLRTHLMRLRRKLGEGAENPKYVVTEPRVGYRMPKAETQGREEMPSQ